MGRRKKVIDQLPSEKLDDIYEDIKNENQIFNIDKREKVNKKKSVEKVKSESDNEKIAEKNKMMMDKISVVEKMLELYPNLKKDKKKIISSVLEKHEEIKQTHSKEYILQKININGDIFYRDTDFNIIDPNLKIVGFYKENHNIYEYLFFGL